MYIAPSISAKNGPAHASVRCKRKILSDNIRRGRVAATYDVEPNSEGEPLARDISTSPTRISSSGIGRRLAGRALFSRSSKQPPFTQPDLTMPHSSGSAGYELHSGL